MGKVRCIKITTQVFNSLQEKDDNALYFVNDSGTFSPESMENGGAVYLGNKLITKVTQQSVDLTDGMKVYYNGYDVTNSSDLGFILANANSHWYGSQGAYNALADSQQVMPGVAYHIMVQPDWSETDPSHLGYVKNQPKILDFDYQSNDEALRFFYTKYNQPYTESNNQ